MPLIASISGVRGTIGDQDSLSPDKLLQYLNAYGIWLKNKYSHEKIKVVVGRDSRVSGPAIFSLLSATLNFLGIEVINLGLVTTPSVEMAVLNLKVQGGIIITASHNPANWNALKFLNEAGEFLSPDSVQEVFSLLDSPVLSETIDNLASTIEYSKALDDHIQQILQLSSVDKTKIAAAKFKVAVDGVNSVGGVALQSLLQALQVEVILLNGELTGLFSHNPEPLAKNLTELSQVVSNEQCDLGLAVDPDGDRLAVVSEDGSYFGEEYTLVAVAKYILQTSDNKITVSNLSSSQALKDVSGQYFAAAVGEINVVNKMKAVGAVIGGEGNGGVIYPQLHYGRDALVGAALFLSYLANFSKKCSELRQTLPSYVIIKDKLDLMGQDLSSLFTKLQELFSKASVDTQDGLKLIWPQSWVHLRPSNTEPIIRIYAEGKTQEEAEKLINLVKTKISEL